MIDPVGAAPNVSIESMDPKTVAAKVQAMFLEVMIKAMEDSIGSEDGLFGGSSSTEIYRGMFRQQLGEAMGEKLGGTLRQELERGMVKRREDAQSPEETSPGLPIASGAAAAVSSAPARLLPVAGRVTSEVGWRTDPFTGEMSLHKGTDIAAPQGTAIRAVSGGTVVESGTKGGYGNAVVIRTDDGHRMLYGHNSANYVQVGDRVEAGQAIAAVGATGRATGPHVHFEVTE